MPRLNLYLLRQLTIAFLFAGMAVSFVVLFTQSFRLLTLVIDNSSTVWMFVQLMLLSIPAFLPLVLPLGLGVAVLFIYNKMAVDSELVVMRAAGVSPLRQAYPAIVLALIVMCLCYLMTLWLTPLVNRTLVAMQYSMKDGYAVLLARPGNFNDITNGLTFYARERGPGGTLEGIFLHDVRNTRMPVTLMAERGQVVDNDGKPELVVFNGRRQEMNVTTGQITQLAFDQYTLDVDSMRTADASRLPDPREQTIYELLHPTEKMLRLKTSRERLLAEMHQRLVSPLLALCYTLIGLATILAGEFNRRGMTRRILLAGLAIITVQAAMMSMGSVVARNIWLAFILYLIPLLPALAAFALLTAERGKLFGSLGMAGAR